MWPLNFLKMEVFSRDNNVYLRVYLFLQKKSQGRSELWYSYEVVVQMELLKLIAI